MKPLSFIFLLMLSAVSHAAFECYSGRPACLPFNKKIVSSNAVCFSSGTCLWDSFVCKDDYDGVVKDRNDLSSKHQRLGNTYNSLYSDHEDLVDQYNDLSSKHQRLGNTYNSLYSDHEDLMDQYNDLVDRYNSLLN